MPREREPRQPAERRIALWCCRTGDGRIYLFGESGETIVLKAGRTPQVIARNRLEGRVLASPAIADGRLFVRTDDEVVAVRR